MKSSLTVRVHRSLDSGVSRPHHEPARTEGARMAISLSDDVKKLIDRPNFAHLSTLMPDGSPQSAPVWVGRAGDRVLIGTGEGSLKAKNTRRDPRVALSVTDMDDPYSEAQLRGRVVERRPDGELKGMDAISRKYTGQPFPWRNPDGRVVLVIEMDKARYTKLPFTHTPPR
jgi:PPOX class probable F420-dependent enzyme